MNKHFVVRFLHGTGHFTDAGMEETVARMLVERWAAGQLNEERLYGRCLITGASWAVLVSSIVGIRCEEYKPQQQQAQVPVWNPNRSGRA